MGRVKSPTRERNLFAISRLPMAALLGTRLGGVLGILVQNELGMLIRREGIRSEAFRAR
jgi:hypothetical protein